MIWWSVVDRNVRGSIGRDGTGGIGGWVVG